VSRRTETSYKAESPGKLAQHNKAPGSGDTVNGAVVQRQFTSLSGEICLPRRPGDDTRKLHPVNVPAGTTGIKSPGIYGKAPAHGCAKNEEGKTG
jgi:hypothetical protein